MKKYLRLSALFLLLCMMLSIVVSFPIFAYNEINYEEAGYNFLLAQYNRMGIEYVDFEKVGAINLFDNNDNVIAKMMIVNRDGLIDYVVLDFVVDRVDEYGLDQKAFVDKFANKKVYYAGILRYAYYDNEILKDIEGNVISAEEFFNCMEVFLSVEDTTPEAVTGFEGFDVWANIHDTAYALPDSTSHGGTVLNSAWSHIPGITYFGLNSNLVFQDQTRLNNNYNLEYYQNISGTCAAVAITNMFIYYDYLGFENAVVSNSVDATFEQALAAVDWFNWTDENWWSKTEAGLRTLAGRAGYDYSMSMYSTLNWDNVTDSIDADVPIFTYIYVELTNGNDFAHAVVTVGYEEFLHKYQTTERYWLLGWQERIVEHEDYYRYLRVIDGWSTSNDARYIDFNGFYTITKGIAFMLEE